MVLTAGFSLKFGTLLGVSLLAKNSKIKSL